MPRGVLAWIAYIPQAPWNVHTRWMCKLASPMWHLYPVLSSPAGHGDNINRQQRVVLTDLQVPPTAKAMAIAVTSNVGRHLDDYHNVVVAKRKPGIFNLWMLRRKHLNGKQGCNESPKR